MEHVATIETEPPAGTVNHESSTPRAPRRLSQGARKALLTAHIIVSVGLLGDSAGYLAVAIRTSTLDDPALVRDSVKTLNMFSLAFGIPLSFAALLTGVALGLGTRWGVFRHPWVVAKLLLVVTVLLVGAFVIGPASNEMLDGGDDRTGRLIIAAAYDVVALATAVGLSVFKPGRPLHRARTPR
jgi:hypothetical protein